MGERKGGHYNSCNLHHFTHYIHLSNRAYETLASPVLHIQIVASIKGNSAEDELA